MNKSISCTGISNESDEQCEAVQINCTDVKMLPGFHPKTFPYFITRTSNFINLVDLKNRISYQLFEDKKPSFDNEFISLVENPNGKVSLAFSSAVK